MKAIFIILPVAMTTIFLTVFLPRFRHRLNKGTMRLWATAGLIIFFVLLLVNRLR